jgi:hypothetical protein
MQKILPEPIYAFVSAVALIVTIFKIAAPTEAEKAVAQAEAQAKAESLLILKYKHQKELQEAKVFFG